MNLLKKWEEWEKYLMDTRVVEEEWFPETRNSQEVGNPVPVIGTQLPQGGQEQLVQLARRFEDVFTEVPGQAKGIYHWIRTSSGLVVREHWRRLLQALYVLVQRELEQMLA